MMDKFSSAYAIATEIEPNGKAAFLDALPKFEERTQLRDQGTEKRTGMSNASVFAFSAES